MNDSSKDQTCVSYIINNRTFKPSELLHTLYYKQIMLLYIIDTKII